MNDTKNLKIAESIANKYLVEIGRAIVRRNRDRANDRCFLRILETKKVNEQRGTYDNIEENKCSESSNS